QCRDERRRLAREQGEWIVVEMKMEKIKFTRLSPDLFQHGNVQSIGIADRTIEPQGPWPERLKLSGCVRVAARKERDVLSERDQLLDQPVHDTLGSTIEFRWDRLGQRSDLGNAHERASNDL